MKKLIDSSIGIDRYRKLLLYLTSCTDKIMDKIQDAVDGMEMNRHVMILLWSPRGPESIDKYILLDVLMCSIAVYFYESK